MDSGRLPDSLASHDPAVRKLILQIYPHVPRSLALHAMAGECYIATPGPNDDNTIGFASLRYATPSHINLPGAIWLHALVVAPEYRNPGGDSTYRVGSTILVHIIDHAKKSSLPRIGLEATASSVKFWEKNGFTPISHSNAQSARTTPMFCTL